MGSINFADLMARVRAIADDRFQGRGPGTPAGERAALWIADEMKRIGLKPGNKGSYFQTVPAVTIALDAAKSSPQELAEIRKLLDERYVKTWEHIGPEIEDQLRHLFEPEFLRDTPMAQLLQFPRYLKAVVLRLNKARQGSMERDLEQARSIRPLWQNALKLKDWLEPKAAEYRWMIEEFRVSLFAQELKTLAPVSAKRLDEQMRLARRE